MRFNRHLQNTLFNHFWKDVFTHWIDFKCNYLSNLPLSNDNILTQSLWFNDNITVNNSSVWYKAWDKKGVRFVNDLLNVDGQFLSFIDFKNRYDIDIDFLTYYGLIHAIKDNWKDSFCEKVLPLPNHVQPPIAVFLRSRNHRGNVYFKHFISFYNFEYKPKIGWLNEVGRIFMI